MMEPRIGPEGRDDELTRRLRAIYRAPADAAYWETLQGKILARVQGEEGWWQPFRGWLRIGLVAAGAAAVAASLALSRLHEVRAHVAFEQIIETPRSTAAQLGLEHSTLPVREATLRYVIEP